MCEHIKFAERPAVCVQLSGSKGNLICIVVKLNVKRNLTKYYVYALCGCNVNPLKEKKGYMHLLSSIYNLDWLVT